MPSRPSPIQQAPAGAEPQLYEEVRPKGVEPAQAVQEGEGNEEQPTPEEEGQYDQLVHRMVKYVDDNQEMILHNLNKDEPVYMNVGHTAAKIAEAAVGGANAMEADISPDAAFNAGAHLVEILMDLGDAAGIWPFEPDDPQYNQQMEAALIQLQKEAGEKALAEDDGSLQSEAADFMATNVAQEADAGTLDPNYVQALEQGAMTSNRQVSPGVAEAVKRGKQ